MKKKMFAVLSFAPLIALAAGAGPFDGTWKSRLDAAKFSDKPRTIIIDANGTYSCTSCVPPIEVKANGTDQAVTGHDYYDTVSVTMLDYASYRVVRKKAGKVMLDEKYAVLPDKNWLEFKFVDQTGTQPIRGDFLLSRVAPGPAGSHTASGSWRMEKVKYITDNGITMTLVSTPDGIKVTTPTGQSYDAKFNGKPVLQEGDIGKTMVSLKKLGPREFEETDKRDGKTTDITKFKLSADGKTLTLTDHDVQHDRTDIFVLEKQS
jgi:hypothetical protein